MSHIKDTIANVYKWAFANRPKVNGFPHLAEALRQAGVTRYVYNLPSCQCIFHTHEGCVASQMDVLAYGLSDVPEFNKEAFVKVLRVSQMGESTFPEFLRGSWEAGVVSYEADLVTRKVSYYGVNGQSYVEEYPIVDVML